MLAYHDREIPVLYILRIIGHFCIQDADYANSVRDVVYSRVAEDPKVVSSLETVTPIKLLDLHEADDHSKPPEKGIQGHV